MLLRSILATIALLLAAVGIYGLIGIRVAPGARSRDVLAMVLLQGMKLAGIGVLMAVPAVVALVAVVASLVPARRAAAVAPADALRHQ